LLTYFILIHHFKRKTDILAIVIIHCNLYKGISFPKLMIKGV
jgi:hypothetical protein